MSFAIQLYVESMHASIFEEVTCMVQSGIELEGVDRVWRLRSWTDLRA